MNHVALDTIGIAGFSHDFGALNGKHSIVTEVFDSFGSNPKASAFNKLLFLLAQVFPVLTKIPTQRKKLTNKLNVTMGEISNDLLIRSRREKDMNVSDTDAGKSIMELLVKAEDQDAELHLSNEEVLAQMKVLLIAGYETTSISITVSNLRYGLSTSFM